MLENLIDTAQAANELPIAALGHEGNLSSFQAVLYSLTAIVTLYLMIRAAKVDKSSTPKPMAEQTMYYDGPMTQALETMAKQTAAVQLLVTSFIEVKSFKDQIIEDMRRRTDALYSRIEDRTKERVEATDQLAERLRLLELEVARGVHARRPGSRGD